MIDVLVAADVVAATLQCCILADRISYDEYLQYFF